MNSSPPHSLLTLNEAFQSISKRTQPIDTECLPLAECHRRILREPVDVPFDSPPFDRSAMDGYALSGEAADGSYECLSVIAAGASGAAPLAAGQCARIFTGAPIPEGSDRVAIQEECAVEGSRVQTTRPVKPGSNIRRRGENARAGDSALSAGEILDATRIGVAASLGKAQLTVSRKPKIWILSTGTELAEPGSPLQPGQIYNSNGPQLAAQIESFGGVAFTPPLLGDHPDAIAHELARAVTQAADMICVSGGASVGEADYTRAALERCGFTIHFHGVDLKPGKPTLFATRDRALAFGIPGNPVSHLAVFALLIAPAIEQLLGLAPSPRPVAELQHAWHGKMDARDRWLPARVERSGTRMSLEFLPWKGSGDLIACRNANAVANLPKNATQLSAGRAIPYAPLDGPALHKTRP